MSVTVLCGQDARVDQRGERQRQSGSAEKAMHNATRSMEVAKRGDSALTVGGGAVV